MTDSTQSILSKPSTVVSLAERKAARGAAQSSQREPLRGRKVTPPTGVEPPVQKGKLVSLDAAKEQIDAVRHRARLAGYAASEQRIKEAIERENNPGVVDPKMQEVALEKAASEVRGAVAAKIANGQQAVILEILDKEGKATQFFLQCADARRPLEEIPLIKSFLKEHTPEQVRMYSVTTHDNKCVEYTIPKEAFGTRVGTILTETHPTPVQGVKGRFKLMQENFKRLNGGEKAAVVGGAAVSLMWLGAGAYTLLHAFHKDPDDPKHRVKVNMSSAMLGAFNTFVGSLFLWASIHQLSTPQGLQR